MQLLNRSMGRCVVQTLGRQMPSAVPWAASHPAGGGRHGSCPRAPQPQPGTRLSSTATQAADAGVYQGDTYQGNGQPDAAAAGAATPVFVSFNVYKGKGALATKVIRPTWETVGVGARIARDGVLLMEFAPAVPNQQRAYDWGSKVQWGMGVPELSTILASPNSAHEFFHDPAKGRGEEGQVTKTLKWSPTPTKDGYFVNVTENNKPLNTTKQVAVSMTLGEFHTFKVLGEYCIPHLLGFDAALAYDPGV